MTGAIISAVVTLVLAVRVARVRVWVIEVHVVHGTALLEALAPRPRCHGPVTLADEGGEVALFERTRVVVPEHRAYKLLRCLHRSLLFWAGLRVARTAASPACRRRRGTP